MSDAKQPSILDALHDEWTNVDSKMNSSEPDEEIRRIPQLHAKYIRYLSKYNKALKKANFELAKLKKFKQDYFMGRLSDEDLQKNNLKPFKYILKEDIKLYLEADDDLQAAQWKIFSYEEIVDRIQRILKQIDSRSFNMRSYVDWQKFKAGSGY